MGVTVSDKIKIDTPACRPSPSPPRDPVLDIRLGPDEDTPVPTLDELAQDREVVVPPRGDRRLLALVAVVSVCALGLAFLAIRRGGT